MTLNFDFSPQIISMGIMQLNLCTLNAMKPFIVLEGKKWESRKLLLKDITFEMAVSQ